MEKQKHLELTLVCTFLGKIGQIILMLKCITCGKFKMWQPLNLAGLHFCVIKIALTKYEI